MAFFTTSPVFAENWLNPSVTGQKTTLPGAGMLSSTPNINPYQMWNQQGQVQQQTNWGAPTTQQNQPWQGNTTGFIGQYNPFLPWYQQGNAFIGGTPGFDMRGNYSSPVQPQQPTYSSGGGGDNSFPTTENVPELDLDFWGLNNFDPIGFGLGLLNPWAGLAYSAYNAYNNSSDPANPNYTQPTTIDFTGDGMTYSNPNTGQGYTYGGGVWNSAADFMNQTGIGDQEWDPNAPGFSWNTPNTAVTVIDKSTPAASTASTSSGDVGSVSVGGSNIGGLSDMAAGTSGTYSSANSGDVGVTSYGDGQYGFTDTNGEEVGYEDPGGDDSGDDSGDSGSYIATATTQALGEEGLKVFEDWRDYMFNVLPTFTSSFGRYRVTAPKIVEEIDKKENSKEIYKGIWDKYLKPIFDIIKTDKDSKKALKDYKVMVRELSNKYLKGVSDGK